MKLRLKIVEAKMGIELNGDFFLEGGQVWKYEFGSGNSSKECTEQWNGCAWLMEGDYIITLEQCQTSK